MTDDLSRKRTVRKGTPCGVTQLAWDEKQSLLYTGSLELFTVVTMLTDVGDEKGYIRAWTLKDLLPRMNVRPLNFHGNLEYEVQQYPTIFCAGSCV